MPSKYKTHHLPTEITFVMIKPDGVMRGLIGEVVKRFEQRGLKIVGMKMMEASREKVDGFYPNDKAWITRLGSKGLATFTEFGIDAKKEMGTDDPLEIGTKVREGILRFMTMGPVVGLAIEGIQAIAVVRKLVGPTAPGLAEPGTIRGDLSHDLQTAANIEDRSLFNVVHASETKEEAAHEIDYWFKSQELFDYDRAEHVIMFGDKRHL